MYRHSESKDRFEKINIQGEKKTGIIRLKTGRNIYFKTIRVKEDSLHYQPVINDSLFRYPLNEVMHIEFQDHFVGAFDGFAFGFAGGAAVAAVSNPDESIINSTTIIVGAGGGMFGAVSGMLWGSKVVYKFIDQHED